MDLHLCWPPLLSAQIPLSATPLLADGEGSAVGGVPEDPWELYRELLRVLQFCRCPTTRDSKQLCVGNDYEVSDDIFLRCLCCLLLAKEAVFRHYPILGGPSGTPLQLLLFFVTLLGVLASLRSTHRSEEGPWGVSARGPYIRTGTTVDPGGIALDS